MRGVPATVLAGTTGEVLIAVVVLVAVAAIAWAVTMLIARDPGSKLEDALSPYEVHRSSAQTDATGPSGGQDLVESPVLRRMVNSLGQIATRRGVLQNLEGKLDQADLPIRPAEALFIYVVGVVFAAVLGLLLGNIIFCLVAGAVVAVAPWMVLNVLATRRTDAFTRQLPDMLQLLGTTLRSGFSIMQGLDTVSRQVGEPIGEHIRQAVAETRLGRSLTDALNDVAVRVRSEDFTWVVTAIAIQREVGGNLAELLDIVSETMTARSRLRREVKTLTAEGRIGAIIISIMPLAIGLFVWSVNPSYLDSLFQSTTGKFVVYGSILLALAGMVWIRKVVKIEV
jgi:tight adherence protein B